MAEECHSSCPGMHATNAGRSGFGAKLSTGPDIKEYYLPLIRMLCPSLSRNLNLLNLHETKVGNISRSLAVRRRLTMVVRKAAHHACQPTDTESQNTTEKNSRPDQESKKSFVILQRFKEVSTRPCCMEAPSPPRPLLPNRHILHTRSYHGIRQTVKRYSVLPIYCRPLAR